MTELRNVVLFMALVYGLGLFLLGLYVRGVREDVMMLETKMEQLERVLPQGWKK